MSSFRSQDQLVVGSVQSAGSGVVLTQPLPVSDNVPCELSFTAHPMSDEFCIKNVVIVSEARNVELYVDGCYAKTARGIMLTIRKGRYDNSVIPASFAGKRVACGGGFWLVLYIKQWLTQK